MHLPMKLKLAISLTIGYSVSVSFFGSERLRFKKVNKIRLAVRFFKVKLVKVSF